jgi:ATP-dependent DNA helicase RecG
VTAVLGLHASVEALDGVGPRRAAAMAAAGVHTIEDLLLRFPFRYEDRGRIQTIAALRPGVATIRAEVLRVDRRPTRRPRFSVIDVVVSDGTGTAHAVWFNQPYLLRVFQPGQWVVLHGRVEWTGQGPQLATPDHEFVDPPGTEADDDGVHTGRIVPVYERLGPLTPKVQRALVHQALRRLPDVLPDVLPVDLRAERNLPDRRSALWAVHFPEPDADLTALAAGRTPAQVRLILEEFFLFQVAVAERRATRASVRKPHRITVTPASRALARQVLPFSLTAGQKEALVEIVADLQRPEPMHRLLQGDVGAGKTMVALLAAIVAMASGVRVALMVPTEILAAQHARTLEARLDGTPFRVALVTGSQGGRVRASTLQRISGGAVDLVVGTHALLEDPVDIPDLGLVIVDEQHRFGVAQRATLRAKGAQPDVLVMTATPIPRTLSLTVFGDLDVSVIRDLPPGRTPVRTTVRPASRREEAYAFVRTQVEAGRQAYVVLPLVEESEKVEARAAVETAAALEAGALRGLRIGVLHGRLAAADKVGVMQAMVDGRIDVLVATTVIEVGVDVPNATVMVVEHAERFGLAQLHQLRGRVGRGADASYCVLLYEGPLSDVARARLEAMAATADGFVIAERDLALRGPGDLFGTRQAGLPALRIGDLARDHALMTEAHALARTWLAQAPAEAPARVLAREAWTRRFRLGEIG